MAILPFHFSSNNGIRSLGKRCWYLIAHLNAILKASITKSNLLKTLNVKKWNWIPSPFNFECGRVKIIGSWEETKWGGWDESCSVSFSSMKIWKFPQKFSFNKFLPYQDPFNFPSPLGWAAKGDTLYKRRERFPLISADDTSRVRTTHRTTNIDNYGCSDRPKEGFTSSTYF